MCNLGGREYTFREMKHFAKNNLSQIKSMFGSKVDIAVENTNFYPTDAYKNVTEAKFISEIVYENNIKFLFDIAHAKITCFKKINYGRYKKIYL